MEQEKKRIGRPPKGDHLVQVLGMVSKETRQRIDKWCRANDRTLSQAVRMAVERMLKEDAEADKILARI